MPEEPDFMAWLQWQDDYKAWLSSKQGGNGRGAAAPSPRGGNGHPATTGQAGQVAKSMATDMTQQANERAAKRVGRNLSQSGVSSIPSLVRQARYRQGYG